MRLSRTITIKLSTLLYAGIIIVIVADVFIHLVDITDTRKKTNKTPITSTVLRRERRHEKATIVCIPGVPCEYTDTVDFRIILMTFRRATALVKTLKALNELEMGGDTAALEIWIDRDKNNHVDAATLKAAKDFKVCRWSSCFTTPWNNYVPIIILTVFGRFEFFLSVHFLNTILLYGKMYS